MISRSEQIAALIDEMDEIENLAASLQPAAPTSDNRPTQAQIRELSVKYLSWHARCQRFLSESGKASFNHFYSGGFGIHKYLTGAGSVTSRRTDKNSFPSRTYNVWRYGFVSYFREPFNEQRLLLMRVRATLQEREAAPPAPPPPPAIDVIRLHPRVKAVSTRLFKDGHYREAIFRACLALKDAVQQRSGRPDLDGSPLMQQVFSQKSPILKFDGDNDEQQGYMWLFAGVMMAVRNPRAHHLGETEDLDANETIELLAMISFLFRALDGAEKVEPPTP